jgi:hypothetical protein
MASAIAVLALGAGQAIAAEGVAYLGHISASVASTLNITERSAMKFGNFKDTAAGTIVLSPTGTRTKTGGITLLYGNGSSQGVASGTDQETGSQAPGFFDITTDAAADVYITFADNAGNIIDSNHPDNKVTMAGPAGAVLTVDSFTFASDDETDGYTGTASSVDPTDASYGQLVHVAGDGTDRIRVGATLHDPGGAATGRYTGTYYIMVSY